MNIYTIISICLALCGMIMQGFFIAVEHKEKYIPAVILKGLASLCFVVIGFIAASQAVMEFSFAKKLVIGLLFGLLGDVCLNLRFVFEKIGQKIFLLGILMFLIGHILYLVALIPYAQKLWLCVAIGALLAAGLLTYIFLTMKVKLAFKIFGVFYLGAVIIMTIIALGIAIITPNPKALVYAVGAVLFTASDIVLIFNTFSGVTRFPLRITNLSLYYAGQLLIATSLFFI
ncbi:MAG: lysoplasmalogenase [Treponema sp.]|nr:lysoplasmalogenase [Treponema sp.]